MSTTGSLNQEVREYWEAEPCGSHSYIVGHTVPLTKEWFERIETYRYEVEPFIHSIAQFTRHHGKRVLEVGVGAGSDHLQWARAGTRLYGVDLTQAAIDTTRLRLQLYGLESNLRRLDAEVLPFDDAFFDVAYSWGVIHHSEAPERIVSEIHRVLKPGGQFIGMLYARRSIAVIRTWCRHALLRGRPWRSFSEVLSNHVESVGTKAYTPKELKRLFESFSDVSLRRFVTISDTNNFPGWATRYFPNSWGWFIGVSAIK